MQQKIPKDLTLKSDEIVFVKNLKKNYNAVNVIKNISFKVKEGEIVGFLGPNGAGKTTTMNILTGCISYNDGNVFVCGSNIFEEPLKVKKNIGYLPENLPLYQNMNVFEYLKFICNLKKVEKEKEEIEKVMSMCDIQKVKLKLISGLSKGYKQRVGIAQALIGSPKLLILDEPTSGLDPAQIIKVRELIKSLSKKHTIIFSSHILSEIQSVCDRIIIINNGEIVADDTETNLLKNYNDSYILRVYCSDNKKLQDSLKEFSDCMDITKINSLNSDVIECCIELKKDVDNFALKLSSKLMKSGIPILQFKDNVMSLEQLFINLIENVV